MVTDADVLDARVQLRKMRDEEGDLAAALILSASNKDPDIIRRLLEDHLIEVPISVLGSEDLTIPVRLS